MSPTINLQKPTISRTNFAIFLAWLFHITGIIGISIGYEEWFVTKTPINLSLVFLIIIMCFPKLDKNFWIAFSIFFIGGMTVEWLGIQYGFIFGSYSYGENLGPKFMGVPWFIGLNWAVLTILTGVIASYIFQKLWFRILLGAALMVLLDFFLEHSAPRFDFWTFENGFAPIKNYIAWFGISVLFHFIYHRLQVTGDTRLSFHLYSAELVFFIWFYGYYQI